MTVNPRRPISLRTATGLGNVEPVRGTGGSSKDTVKSGEQQNTELAEVYDQRPMLTTCATDTYIEYLRAQLACFESVEARAKSNYLRARGTA